MKRPKIAHYYGRLKVAPDAPPEVIRAAYKALVQKYHPDRHHGSVRHEVVLAALNKAQDVLLDPLRRAAHDQWIRQEEVRLGWREPGEEGAPGLLLRLQLLWASVRIDGLPLGEAWSLHLKWTQRVVVVLGAGALLAMVCALFVGALLWLLQQQRDEVVLHRLTPVTASSTTARAGPPALAR